jgi:serine/threonine protein kinase
MSTVFPTLDSGACPERAVLIGFCLGTVSAAELERIARHLNSCGRCLAALQTLDSESDVVMRELSRPAPAEPFSDDECRHVLERIGLLSADEPQALPNQSGDALTVVRPAGEENRPRTPAQGPALGGKVGPYLILLPLGQGGMGAVFKARHTHLGKIVALKVLTTGRMGGTAVTRFVQEMKAVGRLDHPNIVQAYDASAEGPPYLVMEYLDGIDLSKLVKQRGPLPVADACDCVRQAALGLQHAHEHGLVHRDVKPSNLLLTPTGVVKLLDLGLARLHGEPAADCAGPATAGDTTRTDQVLGTADYISPEQLRNARGVDIRADLYSLGCTLYHLLAGAPPFAGSGQTSLMAKQAAHLHQPPPPIAEHRPDVPPGLAAVLDRLLAKDPADRFGTPAEVALALQPFAAGCNLRGLLSEEAPASATQAVPPQPLPQAPAAHRPHPLGPWLAALVLIGVTVIGLRLLLPGMGSLPAPRPTQDERLAAVSLNVEHHRPSPEGNFSLGRMGEHSFAAGVQEDEVRVTARLNQPAYCYLISFRPDGKDELCFPAGAAQPPAPTAEIVFPAGGLYRLNQGGVGLQAFLLLASRQPLPGYDRWKADRGEFPWQASTAEGVWTFDGRTFARRSQRGPEAAAPAEVPPAFAGLVRFCQDRASIEAVSALAFPVQATAPPVESPSAP